MENNAILLTNHTTSNENSQTAAESKLKNDNMILI